MKIDEEVLRYLRGDKFKTNFIFTLEKEKIEPVPREEAIVGIIKNKNVLHIGCSDHIEVIENKIKNNTWLHKLITESAASCIGIDIDKKSIDFIRANLNFNNVLYGNIITDDIEIIRQKEWDYVIFGEIIEHLDDPVAFLKAFGSKYGNHVKGFIITVPNIYNKKILENMLNYREVINSDHRFWFTPFTISKVISAAGWTPENIIFTNCQKLSFTELCIRKVMKVSGLKQRYPYYYFKNLLVSGTINLTSLLKNAKINQNIF